MTSNYPTFNNYYNDSDYNYDLNDFFNSSSPESISAVRWAALIIYVVVFILGLPGNALVVWMTAYEMKRTVNTVWFLNLAIADLLCCLSVPFSIMGIILRNHWPLGLFACKFIPSLLLINMYASVLILMVISMDRCALVIKPVWCQNHRSVKKASLACLVVWVLSLFLTSPSFIFRKTIIKSRDHITCSMDFSLTGEDQVKVETFIAVFRFLMGFLIPFLLITICYVVLVTRVNERFAQSGKTMKVVITVITGFFVCWFPYHVAGLILVSHPNSDLYKSTLKVDSLLISIAFINSCMNPIIYVLMGQDFKSKFKKSVKSILRQVLADEQSGSYDTKKSKSSTETKNTDTQV
ncbi:C5a anaphylatoxin chemotactic receptor 1 [Bombina bombina]|uniref:C5a anaphylatoxin chemotactic receptor 1 n=1 Tax=Bombina bombina TaxID=8345 RepID=UPI00235B0F03|nr:C5a anaphylatoxin chemotactic receptor 1 [Bombina bombina]